MYSCISDFLTGRLDFWLDVHIKIIIKYLMVRGRKHCHASKKLILDKGTLLIYSEHIGIRNFCEKTPIWNGFLGKWWTVWFDLLPLTTEKCRKGEAVIWILDIDTNLKWNLTFGQPVIENQAWGCFGLTPFQIYYLVSLHFPLRWDFYWENFSSPIF